ncbi:hypothetical protein JR316_0008086 [Psilocybe cubensis]|uniref:Uncharacterized protein n=2 Tax=Psilocybe cubensis TaxID=181762 RepID=A0ACB8GVM6_PSICU|nr:hypothetical protein JR316_0008086 [Psilocybe cubensis]KAH9479492.1 hypothetical protein JR316_0008086 [Psilocybe cubensis]
MSTNHRKRKYRGTARSHNSYSGSKSQQHIEPFLSHHEAYLNQQQISSSTAWGVDLDISYRGELTPATHPQPDPLQALYIQAHEANIVKGSSAKIAAQSLEVVEYHTVPLPLGTVVSESQLSAAPVVITPKVGTALIELGDGNVRQGEVERKSPGAAGGLVHSALVVVDDDIDYVDSSALLPEKSPSSIWVDRYDIRLLLNNTRPFPPLSPEKLPPASPTGFSDLPSDAEDTFFFSSTEVEDFRREKRRRVMERTRDERVKARMQEEGYEDRLGNNKEEEDIWGGSDEEPDQTQQDLMERTAMHIASSPNAAQLEMRILANYGADKRFAFLRGRWKRAWGLAKAKARIKLKKKVEDKQKEPESTGVLALAGYGSDSQEDDDEPVAEQVISFVSPPSLLPSSAPPVDPDVSHSSKVQSTSSVDADVEKEEQAKEARRRRLKAWAAQRKAGSSG